MDPVIVNEHNGKDAGSEQSTKKTNSEPTSTNNYPKNWTPQNENVLKNWKASLDQYIFIYQFILDSVQTKLNRILVVIEILSGSVWVFGYGIRYDLNFLYRYKRGQFRHTKYDIKFFDT